VTTSCPACWTSRPIYRAAVCRACWQQLPDPVRQAWAHRRTERVGYTEAVANVLTAARDRYPGIDRG
jgi:hypothetical protein